MERLSSLQRSNLEYIDQLYQQFRENPESVEAEWRLFFEGVEFAQNLSQTPSGFSEKEISAYNLIKTYRDYGHLKANLDPLGLQSKTTDIFELSRFGLSDADLDKTFAVSSWLGLGSVKLREVIGFLEQTYCGTLTCQIAECRPEVREWLRAEFEKPNTAPFSNEDKIEIFKQLARTESIEKFIHTRYVGTKRFSIEGGDALIPMLEHLVKQGVPMGVEEVVIGMAHRGRINVLANFMEKGIEMIFSEFDGTAYNNYEYDGDVKYHLGYSTDKKTANGSCHVALAFNPSHLEAVNPVVLGMSRAKQRKRHDTETRKKVLPVLIHGDAAFAGQGVVSETLQLSCLAGYTVGGAIHVIINNQVGFTTDPRDARSVQYSSDVAKSIKAPVILVNGDDPEACVRAMDMALRFRQQFSEDLVIDLICYRRFGHNEGDEPAFTQPVMYQKIRNHPTPMKIYLDQIAKAGVMSSSDGESFFKQKIDNLQVILDETRKSKPAAEPKAYGGTWKGLRRGRLEDFDQPSKTRTTKAILDQVARVLTTVPSEIQVHPKIDKLIQARAEMANSGHLDWAMGELLAYGSLCVEGTPVRVSGQDCKRGTFTHRQAVYFDVNTNKEFCPLSTLNPKQGEFCIYNSPLSEMAVLGFEYGNSFSDPTFLTIWEAQFGDFANGAQIIIDQFLSSGEEKWARGSGLTLLLPHGYEGQGPEHSSARLERFLQLSAQGNMQVCNLTTPANLFHVLRRQVKRDFRKPLVIMSPKSLLRHPKVISSWSDFTDQDFREILTDNTLANPSAAEVVVLCSGKLYYELSEALEKNGSKKHIALVRIEQLYPFPRVQLAPILSGLPKLRKVIWAQEEPRNMGAYLVLRDKIEGLLSEVGKPKVTLGYEGRTERASPAVGSHHLHVQEQNAIIEAVLKN